MIEQIPEMTALEMWEDYCLEMRNADESPLPFFEWRKEEQIELVSRPVRRRGRNPNRKGVAASEPRTSDSRAPSPDAPDGADVG